MPMPRRLMLLAALCLGLAACSSAPPRPVFPDLRFTGQPPIMLSVARVEIRNDYQPPYHAPNVEHLFPVPPGKAVENWAHDRLKAAGQSGEARFVIQDSSVIEVPLAQTGGIKGAFTTEPSDRYDMTVRARLDIVDPRGLVVRTANVTATRSQSLLNTATPNDRDQAWYDMTSALMVDFDRRMTSEIQNSFGPYYIMP
ncbi:MAG TPA: hypothetical protein VN832_06370 [Stellaceae bacterium]|nr:hypothetical protein [Stellaceae bacterium]